MSSKGDGASLPLFAEAPSEIDVRGFTFWAPWADAIVRPPRGTAPYAKNVDNRPERSALASRVNRHIAIHTGKTIHREGLAWLNATFSYGWTEADLAPAGVILGVARVVGPAQNFSSPWHFGAMYNGKPNVGWLINDVVTFDTPVTGAGGARINGALGCWRLPDDVLAEVRARYAAEKRRAAERTAALRA